jgi:AAA domain, putative AbiEii toxin, Type IV TA system
MPESDDAAADQIPAPVELASQLMIALEATPESLPIETIEYLELLLRRLKALRSGGSISSKVGLAGLDRLEHLLALAYEVERAPAPGTLAEALKSQVPRFVAFDDENRNLRSDYDLGNPSDMSRDALKNLATMADLSLDGLRDASNVGDAGARRTIQEKAQERLADELKNAWKQAPIAVSFDLQGTALSITVSSHERDYFALNDRSDGLRTFIALRGFLAQSEYDVPPILLVDEAETHLHYDAQADLIRVFEQQDAVAQVVYTTHSIGCLPQDLGRGVRVVTPTPDSTRSTIENVWCREDAGVSPLMLAMGASTVPLSPSRFVVIAEGASDAMLLPSLLREATGLSSLAFQVVAGLSEASEGELSRLDREAPRVAYLVDGDRGGAAITARLKKVKVAPGKIVKLSAPAVGVVIEDLIDPGLYAKAIDRYLTAWPPFKGGFPRSLVRRTGRPQAVKTWCEAKGVPTPSKLRVAEEVLRILDDPNPSVDQRIADPSRLAILKATHARLLAALALSAV